MSAPSSHELAVAKLESSGLTWADAKLLGITVHDSAADINEIFPPVPGIKFTYFDPLTFQPAEFANGWGPYYRVRRLDSPPKESGFAKQAENSGKKKKFTRFFQEESSGVMAYFPTNIPWEDIINDPGQPIIITEGELKAAKTCKEGFPTIGLGGVHSYQSAKSGLIFLPQLERIVWVKRTVFIIYDSDSKTNVGIVRALNNLADVLATRGAKPYVVFLPDVSEAGKTGLDDYFLTHSAKDFEDLLEDTAKPLTLVIPLWNLSEKLVYVREPGVVLVRDTGQKLSPSSFKEHAYSAETFSEQIVLPGGKVSLKPASAAAAWLKWPLRTEVQHLTYSPGDPHLMDEKGVPCWNTWKGWGVEPVKGSVKPFLELLDHLFTGAQPSAKEWFIKWLAYPIKYPGIKLFTAACIHGVKHGTGKSLVGYSLKRIYGENFTELNQKDLYAGFNEWAENKQFVMGDDVTGTDKRHDADILKKFITQEELRINIKHVQSFVVPDCINYYFTANQPTTFFLEDDDRRFFIHEVVVGPLSEAWYMDYRLWLETEGSQAIFHYLKNEVDVDDFNPAAPAMKTEAKSRMIADVRSDLGAWVAHLLSTPEDLLRVGNIELKQDIFTNKELLQLYDPDNRTGTTANGLGRELRRVGVPLACDGKTVRGPNGVDRYYIIKNRDKWVGAQPAVVAKHLNDHLMGAKAAKKY